jgi:hypothetical protein
MLFVLAGILLLSIGVAGYGSGLASSACEVDTRGLIGFLVTMMAVMYQGPEGWMYGSMLHCEVVGRVRLREELPSCRLAVSSKLGWRAVQHSSR